MLYREIIAVCSENHTKHINAAVWAERGIFKISEYLVLLVNPATHQTVFCSIIYIFVVTYSHRVLKSMATQRRTAARKIICNHYTRQGNPKEVV